MAHATARAANEAAIAEILAALEAQKSVIGGTLLDFSRRHYAACPIVQHLYQNNAQTTGPVIQVEAEITSTKPSGKKTVWIVLDVDVPLPTSSQGPHIGWELHVDGKRLNNGHCWVAPGVLKVGRPASTNPAFEHLVKRFEVAEMGASEEAPGSEKLVFRPSFMRMSI